jgi:hypothetical protein
MVFLFDIGWLVVFRGMLESSIPGEFFYWCQVEQTSGGSGSNLNIFLIETIEQLFS